MAALRTHAVWPALPHVHSISVLGLLRGDPWSENQKNADDRSPRMPKASRAMRIFRIFHLYICDIGTHCN